MDNDDGVTTNAAVLLYESSSIIFAGIIKEVRELSKKKSDTVMSSGKVKIINRVLVELKKLLDDEPEAKYLDVLDDDALPQVSDAVLIMVQFESAIKAFRERYYRYHLGSHRWVTEDL